MADGERAAVGENSQIAGAFDTRPVRADDLDSLVGHVQAGFDSYARFAPADWIAPRVSDDRQFMAELFADPDTSALIAADAGRSMGHIAFFPARERAVGEATPARRLRPRVPGVAHLWQLFVLPAWWGTGVAPVLHEWAITEMGRRGFTSASLFTPSLHTRARRFYERRGWHPTGEEFNDGLGLMLTDYRLALGDN